jgi:hypothetical protein
VDEACSGGEVRAALTPHPRTQPTGRSGAEPHSGGTLCERGKERRSIRRCRVAAGLNPNCLADPSGSARNVLCAARGPLARHWYGTQGSPRIVRRIRYHDTLEFAIQPAVAKEIFQFLVLLGNPGQVTSYLIPKLGDSGSAMAFRNCLGVQR